MPFALFFFVFDFLREIFVMNVFGSMFMHALSTVIYRRKFFILYNVYYFSKNAYMHRKFSGSRLSVDFILSILFPLHLLSFSFFILKLRVEFNITPMNRFQIYDGVPLHNSVSEGTLDAYNC